MKVIKIAPGKVVHISDDDEVWFKAEEWKHHKTEQPTFVLKRNLLKNQVAEKCGLILNGGNFTGTVEHIDGNLLNCQRDNLRLKS
ncbi:MAG: hypothetical protein V3V68_05025 [Nitrosomonadaceae bacterium]